MMKLDIQMFAVPFRKVSKTRKRKRRTHYKIVAPGMNVCKNCGEENPENAVYCRNCGEKLIDDVKKTEVIEAPIRQNQSNQNTNTSQTTTTSSNNDSNWTTCCICLFVIFIIFALASLF